MKTQEEINESWSESSKNYSWIIDNEIESFRKEKWQNRILRQINKAPEEIRVLDTGCGPGFFSIILLQESTGQRACLMRQGPRQLAMVWRLRL